MLTQRFQIKMPKLIFYENDHLGFQCGDELFSVACAIKGKVSVKICHRAFSGRLVTGGGKETDHHLVCRVGGF